MLNMRSSLSSTSESLNWSSPVHRLFRGNKSKIADQLYSAGLTTLEDLLWILPLRVSVVPPIQSFLQMKEGDYFRGVGKIVSHQTRPNFKARGKGRALLQNIMVVIKDLHSDQVLNLRWFNAYNSINQKIKTNETITFLGVIQSYNGVYQIINPDFETHDPSFLPPQTLKVQYPTVSKVSPNHISQTISRIPLHLWNEIPDNLPREILSERKLLKLDEAFKILHGIYPPEEHSSELQNRAQERLIYEDFFNDQVKIFLRRERVQATPSQALVCTEELKQKATAPFPFQFTPDQGSALESIRLDLARSRPMMRLVQGDVGCGKTAVALAASYMVSSQGQQVAIMCPTEALAQQHFETAQSVYRDQLRVEILTGSTRPQDKKKILQDIQAGECSIIIGTHALIQSSVEFKSLALAIIDEQHKFGVEQRLKLMRKGRGTHCLIMTATPIPRSLSLTQYGDLDITTIRTMPLGRKGHQTRIVTENTMSKYLSFFKTRIELREQAFIVVPAIEDNPHIELHHLDEVIETYRKFFPEFKILGLHGQMAPEDKSAILSDFKNHKIDILVATSVIEVGIDVPNATLLSVINPERFGLSSLHQMRGRVGRGHRPGFCFLIAEKSLSKESLQRLKVIEQNTDGFKISEEDLRIRGEGDLFGREQSGDYQHRRIANLLRDEALLHLAREDVEKLWTGKSTTLGPYVDKWRSDDQVFSTI